MQKKMNSNKKDKDKSVYDRLLQFQKRKFFSKKGASDKKKVNETLGLSQDAIELAFSKWRKQRL